MLLSAAPPSFLPDSRTVVLHMIRALLRLLVLSLVPVMVFTMPRVAEASYQVGDVATASIDVAGFTGSPGLGCGVSGYFVNDSGNAYVKLQGSCGTGWQVSHAAMTLTVDGGSCEFAISYGELDGSGDLTGNMTMTTAGPINPTSCIGTELCYAADVDFHGDMEDTLPGDDYVYTGCVPFGLGQMPEAEASMGPTACPVGDPTTPPVRGTRYTWNNKWSWPWTFNLTMKGQPAGEWLIYYLYRDNGTAPLARMDAFDRHAHGVVTGPFVIEEDGKYADLADTVNGVGLVHVVGGVPAGYYNDTAFWNGTSGVFGANDPATCRFYWGEKATNVEGTDTDEPMGPLDVPAGGTDDPDPTVTPPEPPPAGCDGFSLWDPTSWAGAGICAVVQAVMWLGNTLGRAISGIARAILDGLSALFVPDQGFMEDKADQIKDAWADTPPLVFFDGVQEVGEAFIINAPAGCAGPDLTFTSPVGHEAVTVNPMSACDAGMANLASLVKLALTVLVYVGGFLAGVRIVGAAFGVDAAVGGANT